ncbi:Gp138 family membrane-puncturing spike protein [Rodentibacter caecimuris]|uniref:Gp138 family membrane-puncturing spike protein n=1 Tax=Rodentibacter caecimuris TaxID=1796644 RepID=UPI0013A09709|nr:Gp138 family membrane-puncturing spike protein [Rodentibacter heylii]QIA76189.1 phage baseplate protein [Rodentibacter heylii]
MESKLGLINHSHTLDETSQIQFIINNLIGRIQTVTLVQVKAVKAAGVNPVGTVDVQPMVAQIDGQGNTYEHGIIYNIPYFRLQGGANAVIIDPKEGDIGMCGFCSRDISSVKNNKKPSNPQSLRRFDYSDGLFFGGFLNGVPSQYILFKDEGIDIVSTGEVMIKGTKVKIDAPVETTSTLQVGGDITDNASGGGKSMKTMRSLYNDHTHNGGPKPSPTM